MIAACTQNQMAKNYGGTQTINLPAGEKLITATWKDDHLWYLSRQMHAGEIPETTTLHEQSSFGIIQGTVIFVESAKK